ncbi:MAG: MBL fold metallo-hydrolase, partial [Ruminococcus sp.]|nr:MBL fold metallo-hydrolase [Ruminococcus sp.]
PGHSEGSVCYVCGNVMFTGDTLFHDSIGRTDFPGSNPIDMRNSLCTLKMINGDFKVLPGHGPASSLRYEQNNNPYMRNLK